MKILLSGANGFVGKALTSVLKSRGHEIIALVRSKPRGTEIFWNPAAGEIDAKKLESFDAVIHLAGENIADGRWTQAKKQRILSSRVAGTQLLCRALALTQNPPKVLLCASAIGFYGDRGAEILNEKSAKGNLFLSQVCREWENAAEPARQKGIRVAHLRFGVILSADGGALAKMLTPFRLGAGGIIGSGRQYMSWVALDDVIGAIEHALQTETLKGPVNVVAPEAVTNAEFTKVLAKALHRPAIFPMPAFVSRIVFGEMADELLLASTRVAPEELQKSGYAFKHARLDDAFRNILK